MTKNLHKYMCIYLYMNMHTLTLSRPHSLAPSPFVQLLVALVADLGWLVEAIVGERQLLRAARGADTLAAVATVVLRVGG